jgi:hypothetical protein
VAAGGALAQQSERMRRIGVLMLYAEGDRLLPIRTSADVRCHRLLRDNRISTRLIREPPDL